MSKIKALQSVGLASLCDHLKRVRAAAENARSAADTLDNAEKLLDSELKGLIAELQAETESLTNAMIVGEMPTNDS